MQTNLNMLFQQLVPNFAHIIPTQSITKNDFLETIKSNYDTSNPKTLVFYESVLQSEFTTIRLSNNRETILFND